MDLKSTNGEVGGGSQTERATPCCEDCKEPLEVRRVVLGVCRNPKCVSVDTGEEIPTEHAGPTQTDLAYDPECLDCCNNALHIKRHYYGE